MGKPFSEVSLAGGAITFTPDGQSRYEMSSPLPVSIQPFNITSDFEYEDEDGQQKKGASRLGIVLVSDKFGMFGRCCPECSAYFRAQNVLNVSCPYCACHGQHFEFLTENQKEFVEVYSLLSLQAILEGKEQVMDIESIASNLSSNEPPKWAYAEEHQQSFYRCPNCRSAYDILGEFGGCPWCEQRNSFQVFTAKIDQIFYDIETGNILLRDALIDVVSIFEAMSKDLQVSLLRKYTNNDSKIKRMNFQRIFQASEILKEVLGFDLFFDVPEECLMVINRMFSKRHLFVHNAGRADAKYLSQTGDSVRLHQTIGVGKDEFDALTNSLLTVALRLVEYSHSLIDKDMYLENPNTV